MRPHQIRIERLHLSANHFSSTSRKCQRLTGTVLGLARSGGWWDFVIEYCSCDSLISCLWPEYGGAIFSPAKFILRRLFGPKYSPGILLVIPGWNINVLEGGVRFFFFFFFFPDALIERRPARCSSSFFTNFVLISRPPLPQSWTFSVFPVTAVWTFTAELCGNNSQFYAFFSLI